MDKKFCGDFVKKQERGAEASPVMGKKGKDK